jgi:hypothetical protein
MHFKTKSVIAAALLAAVLAVPVSAAQRTRSGDDTPGTFIAKVIKQIKRLLPTTAHDDVGGPKP